MTAVEAEKRGTNVYMFYNNVDTLFNVEFTGVGGIFL
jgi:hypothetical protein